MTEFAGWVTGLLVGSYAGLVLPLVWFEVVDLWPQIKAEWRRDRDRRRDSQQ